MHQKRYIILIAAMFLIGAAAFFMPIVQQIQEQNEDAYVYENIAESVHITIAPQESPTVAENLPQSAPDPEDNEPVSIPSALPELAITPTPIPDIVMDSQDIGGYIPSVAMETLKKQNPDFVAWLSIPGTVIDYPVVHSDNTDFYLKHMFDGKESKLGCLFSLMSSDYDAPSQNIAIYGHHLSNSDAMFSTLLKYKEESWWQDHPTITLETLNGLHTYRIFAVLNQRVSDWDASTASFPNDAAFLRFVNRARKAAFYDTGIEITAGDHILTLITCDRSHGGVQGRLLVMAIQKKENNS